MEVTTKADRSTSLGEMTTGEYEVGMIAEMIDGNSIQKLDNFIPGASATGAALAAAAKDESPEFPVVRVEEGWSGSKRLWTAKEVESIVAQCNALQPVGHLGHIKDEDEATIFPKPQTTWFAATAKKEPSRQKDRLGEMVTTAYFAGYNLPGADVRTYIPAKAVRGISWWGRGEQVPIPGRGVEVRNFVLKHLDWARKLAEGMPSSSVVAVTGEQETNMAKELSQVTPEEFKAENPNGYALLVAEATRDKDATIAEMDGKVKEGEKAQTLLGKVCEAVGLDPAKADDLLTKVEELKMRVGDKAKVTVSTAVEKLLKEKLPGDDDDSVAKRALVMRLLPMGEMETKIADAKPEDAEKLIGEMVDASFDKDDIVKNVVGEMQPPNVRRREDLSRSSGSSDAALKDYGVQRERVTLGS